MNRQHTLGYAIAMSCFYATAERHPFPAAGWKSGGPAIYDAGFGKTWQKKTPDEIGYGWVLPDGGVVYSLSNRKEGTAVSCWGSAAGMHRQDVWK